MIKVFGYLGDLVFSKTTKDTGTILISNAIASILTIVFTVFTARFLGPESWIIIAAVINFIAIIIAVGEFGLSAGIFRFISKYWLQHEYSQANKILGILFSLRFFSALVLGGVIILLSPFLTGAVIKSSNSWLLIISTISIVGSLLIDFQITSLEAKRRWYTAAIFIVLTSLFRVILTVIVFYSYRLTIPIIIIIFSLSPLLAYFVSLFFERLPNLSFVDWSKQVKNMVSFSGWMGVNRIFGAISSRVDIFLLLHLTAPFEAGIFAAARQLAQGVPVIIGSFATVIAPRFATYEKGELKASFKKALFLSILISMGIIIGIALADPIMSLFGPKYIGSTRILQMLLVGLLPFALSTPMTNLLVYSFHKPQIIAVLSVIQLPLIILGNLYYIPLLGAFGAVLVFVIWNISTLIVTSLFTWYYLGRIK